MQSFGQCRSGSEMLKLIVSTVSISLWKDSNPIAEFLKPRMGKALVIDPSRL